MWYVFVMGVMFAVVAGNLVYAANIPSKMIDISSILLGSIAIFAAIAEARRLPLSRSANFYLQRLMSTLDVVRSVSRTYLDIIKLRISNKSSNLSEYQSSEDWFAEIVRLSHASEEEALISIKRRLPDFPSNTTDREILALKSELLSSIDRYEKLLSRYEGFNENLQKTAAEEVAIFMAPYAITIAVSLTLFKTIALP